MEEYQHQLMYGISVEKEKYGALPFLVKRVSFLNKLKFVIIPKLMV